MHNHDLRTLPVDDDTEVCNMRHIFNYREGRAINTQSQHTCNTWYKHTITTRKHNIHVTHTHMFVDLTHAKRSTEYKNYTKTMNT